MADYPKTELVKIAALWAKETKDGEIMYTGKLGDAKLIVLRNKWKEAENHPDYNVFVSKDMKPQGQGERQPRQNGSTRPAPPKKEDSGSW